MSWLTLYSGGGRKRDMTGNIIDTQSEVNRFSVAFVNTMAANNPVLMIMGRELPSYFDIWTDQNYREKQ